MTFRPVGYGRPILNFLQESFGLVYISLLWSSKPFGVAELVQSHDQQKLSARSGLLL